MMDTLFTSRTPRTYSSCGVRQALATASKPDTDTVSDTTRRPIYCSLVGHTATSPVCPGSSTIASCVSWQQMADLLRQRLIDDVPTWAVAAAWEARAARVAATSQRGEVSTQHARPVPTARASRRSR
jgi:hypothetical protein